MRYLDTNVIIRIITGDHPAQAKEALEAIDEADQNDFYIDATVLVETCFVLEFHDYAMKRRDIAEAFKSLIGAPQIQAHEKALTALEIYKVHPKLDLTDCWLLVRSGKNGIYTFDNELQQAAL